MMKWTKWRSTRIIALLAVLSTLSGCDEMRQFLAYVFPFSSGADKMCLYYTPFQVFHEDPTLRPDSGDAGAFSRAALQGFLDSLQSEGGASAIKRFETRHLAPPRPKICALAKVTGDEPLNVFSRRLGQGTNYVKCMTQWGLNQSQGEDLADFAKRCPYISL